MSRRITAPLVVIPSRSPRTAAAGLEEAAGHPQVGLARLVGIGRGAEGHELAAPRDRGQPPRGLLFGPGLDVDHGWKSSGSFTPRNSWV